jgi:hypothetical protein
MMQKGGRMHDISVFEAAQFLRQDLAKLFHPKIEPGMAQLNVRMDPEIEQEIRERIAVLILDEMVNDMPMVPYLAVWQDGATEIAHAYMSPKLENLSGYTAQELSRIGYINIVTGDIISFYREGSGIEEKVNPVREIKEKRVAGYLDNKNWEGCYKVKKKCGKHAWVIDRATITRFRNTVNNNIICLSGGILLETTELLERREDRLK